MTDNYNSVSNRQTKRPLDSMEQDVQASQAMLEELANADKRMEQDPGSSPEKRTTHMEQDLGSSSDFLANIIQEVKQDHPEQNFDKMAEAILQVR